MDRTQGVEEVPDVVPLRPVEDRRIIGREPEFLGFALEFGLEFGATGGQLCRQFGRLFGIDLLGVAVRLVAVGLVPFAHSESLSSSS